MSTNGPVAPAVPLNVVIDAPVGRQDMGLRGMLAQYFNAGAMGCVAIVMFLMISQVQSMHREGVDTLKSIMDRQVQILEGVVKENTRAINELATEVRAMRAERQKER